MVVGATDASEILAALQEYAAISGKQCVVAGWLDAVIYTTI